MANKTKEAEYKKYLTQQHASQSHQRLQNAKYFLLNVVKERKIQEDIEFFKKANMMINETIKEKIASSSREQGSLSIDSYLFQKLSKKKKIKQFYTKISKIEKRQEFNKLFELNIPFESCKIVTK